MIVAAAVEPDGHLGHSWGKARSVVVARVEGEQVLAWQVHQVSWDRLHDAGTHGSHHARVVSFLREHRVEAVAVDHVGEGMRRMLASMGVRLVEDVHGPAREALLAIGRAGGDA